MITISYAITACNEYLELHNLLRRVTSKATPDDEIVVLLDTDSATSEVKALCNEYKALKNFHLHYNSLNKNFAQHKNKLNRLCTKDWIFNIDADEYPSDSLLDNLRDILTLNSSVDIISVPRVNRVSGLTEEHVRRWMWRVDEQGRVNWPDYQMRLYKNKPEIVWEGRVHEKPVGWKIGSHIPYQTEEFALMHFKDIARQEKQNSLYNSI